MIESTMQDRPLSIAAIFEHGRRVHPRSAVSTYDGAATARRSFAEIADGAERLAAALLRLGIRPGDAVGPSVGTMPSTSRRTSRCRASAPCCTRSTCG